MNILEDVRVEKLCKRKYPGSSKHFYNGYNELNNDDFFSTKDENLNELSFIDRINLYYKIGAFLCIDFTDKENESDNSFPYLHLPQILLSLEVFHIASRRDAYR